MNIHLSAINFYIRARHFGTAFWQCEETVREGRDEHILLLRALILVLLEKRAEGMRQLEALRSGVYSLGALHALRYAHSKETNPDKESLREIDNEISKQSKNADDENCYAAAEVLFLTDQTPKAKLFAEKALNGQPENPEFECLLGWIEWSLGRDAKTAQKLFESAAGKLHPDAFLGRIAILEDRRQTAEMIIVAKELCSQLPTFVPGHLEVARATLIDRDWVAATQSINNALLIHSENVYAHLLLSLHTVCIKGTQSSIDTSLAELMSAFEATEGENHCLAYSIADLFTRCAVKNTSVIQFSRKMLDRALSFERKSEYLSVALRIMIHSEDTRGAMETAKELVGFGSDEPMALLGVGLGYMASGRSADAASQFSFLKEAHAQLHTSPLFMFFGALVSKFSDRSFDQFFVQIKNAVDTHISHFQQNGGFGVSFVRSLDPAFLVDIALQLFDYAPPLPTKSPDASLKEVDRVLSIVNEHCPGLSEVTFLLARCKYLMCEGDSSERLIDSSLERNDAIAEAYLLKAQIKIEKGRIEDAEICLDTGLSFNFAIRDSAIYHLIKAKVLKKRNDDERAVELLRAALKSPQKTIDSQNLLIRGRQDEAHRISLYLELVDSLQTLKKTEEAERVLRDAMSRWAGKAEEEQLLLTHAHILVSKGDVDGALAMLARVQPSQSNYHAARSKMAQIYLEEKKDKRMFTICYKELLENEASPVTFALLGDAYMKVQNPTKAIEVYEKALKANPKDHALARKIGEAYVQCHLFSKAVNYYEAAVKSGRDSEMRLKLANLLFQLGNFEKCERVLREPLEKEENPTDSETRIAHVAYWSLLSKLHYENGNWQDAVEDLTRAKSLQLRLVGKNDGNTLQLKKEAAKICCNLAELHTKRRELNRAVDLYKEASQLNETDIKVILALAQIYMTMGKLHLCNQQCQLALNIDKNNDEATLMMADLLYLKNEGDQAVVHFAQLLERYPNHYHALARTIELSWRAGDVDLAEKHLKRAMENNPRASVDAGYNFCKGLHDWYSGEPNSALQSFNRARRDLEWGERAIYNMIEICLNPDNEIIGGEVLEHAEEGSDAQAREMGTKTAERFLKELRFKPGVDIKYALMENFILVASTNKSNVQTALNNLLEMIGPEGDRVVSVGAVLGSARAYMLLKQTQKAKHMLKRVITQPWTLDDADYLEKCWLLLADLYINQNKTEQATNILRTILQHNASSIKAFEFMGFLKEKEQKWADAAANYEEAWRLCKQRNPAIGYKLAYNYMKCKRLFDSIEVCHRVLQQYPSYPKIKKEIMDKARMNIRT